MNYKYIEIPGTELKRIGGEAITDNKMNVIKAGLCIFIVISIIYWNNSKLNNNESFEHSSKARIT